jgi:hypothetical protein
MNGVASRRPCRPRASRAGPPTEVMAGASPGSRVTSRCRTPGGTSAAGSRPPARTSTRPEGPSSPTACTSGDLPAAAATGPIRDRRGGPASDRPAPAQSVRVAPRAPASVSPRPRPYSVQRRTVVTLRVSGLPAQFRPPAPNRQLTARKPQESQAFGYFGPPGLLTGAPKLLTRRSRLSRERETFRPDHSQTAYTRAPRSTNRPAGLRLSFASNNPQTLAK